MLGWPRLSQMVRLDLAFDTLIFVQPQLDPLGLIDPVFVIVVPDRRSVHHPASPNVGPKDPIRSLTGNTISQQCKYCGSIVPIEAHSHSVWVHWV